MSHVLRSSVALLLLQAVVSAAEPRVIFQDRFEGKLCVGWTWLRENPQAWRIKDSGLEIRAEPGAAKNALVCKVPERSKGKLAAEVTITFITPPTGQFEQAGITWYRDGQPSFKLVHELIDGKTYVIPGRRPTTTRRIQLRLIFNGDSYTAQFRPESQGEYQTVANGRLPPPGDDRISLQCCNGSPDASHWVRFTNFRLVELPE